MATKKEDDYDLAMNQQESDKTVEEGPLTVNHKMSDYNSNDEAEEVYTPQKKLVRQTNLRWVMLAMACCFLMGSYFCYDNPAPLKSRLIAPPFDLSDLQFNALYSIYSFPNMVLPIIGGVLMDKLGVRPGLIVFTVILTIGQLVFAIGGLHESFSIMMLGRFIFGLGGENMTVGQCAIITQWFKGAELNFAFGLNLSVARLGSTINGPVENAAADAHSVGYGLMIGFGVCLFSLCVAIGLVSIDYWAEKKDNVAVEKDPNDRFQCKELSSFKLPFWLIVGSCVVVYMVVFIYIGNASEMLQTRFGFTEGQASLWYTTPYMISAFASPALGFVIDKIGHRALFICTSSVLILLACIITMLLTGAAPGETNYAIFIPLIFLGVGYSVYAAALWGGIPYTCEPKQVGTAFGMCTAVQNIGLTISPLVAGPLLKYQRGGGYFWYLMYFCVLAAIGVCLNVWLYFDDIKNRGGLLDKVDKGETIKELTASPTPTTQRRAKQMRDELAQTGDDNQKAALLDYHTAEGKTNRDSLRRSLAKPH